MNFFEKREYNRIKHMTEVVANLINSYKATLYDLEHDHFPENEVIRKECIRIILAGSGCKTIEEAKEYYENQIARLEKEQHELYLKMAKYSKWSPTVHIEN